MGQWFWIYLGVINAVGLLAMGIDKECAQRKQWRIPEKGLFLIAILGGSLGSWMGMYSFRHKTKHSSFVFGIPIIMLIQGMIICCCWMYVG